MFGLEPGEHSGDVEVTLPRVAEHAAYEPQYSLDGKKTWLPFPQAVTTKTKVTLPTM